MAAQIPLFRRWPELEGRLPRIVIADIPTPVEELVLSDHAGVRPLSGGLWVKRDDLTDVAYGGNKVRKLEFLLGDARAQGRDSVWTVGAVGSNHCLATAVHGRQQGFEVNVLHFPQPPTDHVSANILAISSTGARLTLASTRSKMAVAVAKAKVKTWFAGSDADYYIPGGGSSPVGALGYVNAALELADQIAAGQLPEPERIYVAMGTSGTYSGLWLGCRLAGLETQVIGIRVVDLLIGNEALAARLVNGTNALLRAACGDVPEVTADAADMQLRHTYLGDDYGVPTARGTRAIELLGESGIQLEPTYTAKTFGALLDEVTRPNTRPSGPVVYWHTLSSADLSGLVAASPGPQALPRGYQRYFEGPDE
jgi:D-cysteine desulfhydrase